MLNISALNEIIF